MRLANGFTVIGVCLAFVGTPAQAQKKKKTAGTVTSSASEKETAIPEAPWVGARAGAAIPLSPAGGIGFKAEADVGLYQLPKSFQLAGLVAVSQGGVAGPPAPASATGLEIALGLQHWYQFGNTPLAVHGMLAAGYAHRRTVTAVEFTGNQLTADNAFMARLTGSLTWRLAENVLAWVEPVNFGLYIGSATRWEYSPLIGLGFCK